MCLPSSPPRALLPSRSVSRTETMSANDDVGSLLPPGVNDAEELARGALAAAGMLGPEDQAGAGQDDNVAGVTGEFRRTSFPKIHLP